MNASEKPKFDSVILAGGFGKRLNPLTDTLPKPMLPIASESAFVRNLKLLRHCGFNSTAVTTMYLAEKIESAVFNDGYTEYLREELPLGSAGAVASLKDRAEDCILIMSGDAVCDFDLRKVKEDFLKSGCDAGIVLCRTQDSGEYGSVCVSNGRIQSFCEKPSVRDTLSDLINTGIYFINKKVLDMIPENEFSDFAHDLFPAVMRKNLPIAALEPMGHWFDIGSFGEYHRCNMWASGAENCIGKHTSIHPNARIEFSVIFDNCTIGNSVLRGCIIAEGTVIGNDCIVPPGCVIGANAELRDGVSLAPGSIVGSGVTLTGDSFADTFPKPKQSLILDDDFVVAEDGDDGYFVRLGRLLGGEGSIIAFAEGDGMTLPQACEIAFGVSETGSNCTVVSGGNAAIAAFAAAEYGSRTAYIARVGEQTEIRLYSQKGMPFSREELRKLSSENIQLSEKAGSVFLLPHGALLKRYLFHLNKNALMPKKINIAKGKENSLLRECAEELDIETDSTLPCFSLSADGEKASVTLTDGREISYWQLLTVCCIKGHRNEISLPNDTPNAVEQLLRRHSVEVGFYNDNESEQRKKAEKDTLPRDGILLALTAAGIAERSGMSLSELAESLPSFTVTTRLIFADREKMSSVISRIREENGGTRNAAFDFGDGRVSVYASASGRFRLVAEAVDSETAEEISLRAADMLEKRKKSFE